MKWWFCIGLILGVFHAPAMAIEMRLMTGDVQGTYYQIGREIAEQTEKVGITLNVLPSEGSWANITALVNNDTEFAIFQLDAYLKAARNYYVNTDRDLDDEIKLVMSLYHDEIHVLKAKGRPLDFIGGTSFRVGCGPANSGSCMSADVIASFYDKKFSYVYSGYEKALAELRKGKLDLVVITGGKPLNLLAGQTGLDLVELPRTEKAALVYLPTTITSKDYAWLDHPVQTYGVRTVLATMIQEQEGLANDLVGTVHFTILANEKHFKREGHPKWNDVLFTGYNERVAHISVLNSLRACNVIKSYGYECTDLARD